MSSHKHFILGTAGHIDHGKSSLVRVLTGTDPDRLPEEQRRGVTIELGFAHLALPDPDTPDSVFELGIVDVPGHADFVNNMVAGVGGMDVALFVVAADDGWMPQSEEHLHILSYLGIERAVIALTKADLAEDLEFSAEFVRECLVGSPFEGTPIIPVSSIERTGIEELRSELVARLRGATLPPDFGKALLPIDRAFTVKGIGTVVTGTLSGGQLRVGDRLVLQPDGTAAHVRSIQNHSASVEQACPGMRTALNLPELPVAARKRLGARRGALLTWPEAGAPSDTLNIQMERLDREIPGQPGTRRSLPSGRRVRVHHGSGAVGARLFLVEDTRSIAPGERMLAQLRLDEPRFMMVGDRVVLRDWSGETTLGGGTVLEAEASRRGLRNDSQVSFLEERRDHPGDLGGLLHSALARDALVDVTQLAGRLRFSPEEVDSAVAQLVENGVAHRLGARLASADWWEALLVDATNRVEAYHKKNSDLPGLPLGDLRKAIVGRLPEESLFDDLLASLDTRGIRQHGTVVARADFQPALPDEIRKAAAGIEQALGMDPLNPPGRAELAADSETRRALSFLVRSGSALELTDKVVLLTATYEEACERIVAHLKAQGQATASDLRQQLGTSRRIIMPLLERMDAEGRTQRNGDFRTAR